MRNRKDVQTLKEELTTKTTLHKACWILHKHKKSRWFCFCSISLAPSQNVKHITHTVLTASDLYELRMQRPLAHENSLAEQELRVQFWCSSKASEQSASPSHTQSRRMHFLWGGLLLIQVNSWGEQERLAARSGRNTREGNIKNMYIMGAKSVCHSVKSLLTAVVPLVFVAHVPAIVVPITDPR